MLELRLHGETWQTYDDFFDALFAVLKSPGWHGRNFNALWDSIGGGGINEVEPPYRFVITGRPMMGKEAARITDDFCDLIRELRERGTEVDVSCN